MEESDEFIDMDENDAENLERQENLEKLQEYVNQMAYRMLSQEIVTCEHTQRLATPKKKYVIGMYDEHGHVLQPKERADRIRRKVMKLKAITTEQLQDAIRKEQQNENRRELIRRKQESRRHKTLAKLQKHCVEKIMSTLINKFSKYIAHQSANYVQPTVITENFQRLQKSIICHLYSELNLQPNWPDYPVFNAVSSVIAELMLQALFLYQNSHKYVNNKDATCEKSDEDDQCKKLLNEQKDNNPKNRTDQQEFNNLMRCYDL